MFVRGRRYQQLEHYVPDTFYFHITLHEHTISLDTKCQQTEYFNTQYKMGVVNKDNEIENPSMRMTSIRNKI